MKPKTSRVASRMRVRFSSGSTMTASRVAISSAAQRVPVIEKIAGTETAGQEDAAQQQQKPFGPEQSGQPGVGADSHRSSFSEGAGSDGTRTGCKTGAGRKWAGYGRGGWGCTATQS